MRWPTFWRGGAAVLAAAALTIGLSGAIRADDEEQEAQTEQSVEQDVQEQGAPIRIAMSVTENREPGLAGSATLTPLGNRMWRVEISMTGLPANDAARPAHIHTAAGARCDNGAPVTYPLTNVAVDAMGRGTSVSTITVTDDKPIEANNAYVNVHNPAQMGRGVFCGNITVNIGAAAPPAAAQPGAQRPAAAPAAPAAPRPAAAPAAQRPAAAPAAAQPGAQRPAAAPAAAAPRPAAAPAAAPAQRPAAAPAALPRTGTGGLQAEQSGAWALAGAALAVLLLGGSGVLAVARRRR